MNRKFFFWGIALLIVGSVAYCLISPAFRVVEKQDASPVINEMPAPEGPKTIVIAQGAFKPSAHDVSGKALLIEDQGKSVLRFEDFETINGPDLRIYLSSSLGVEDAIDLGPIQATKGNVNYGIDQTIDRSKYRNVLVWCRAFRVLFSYAQLQ